MIRATLLRWLSILSILGLCAAPAYSSAVTRGYVERGGQKVVSSLTGSSVKAQRSYPGATVTVWEHGTTTLSTIYLNDCSTPLANPFTADSTGYYEFCAAAATYDLHFSGSEIAVPWTVSAVINEPATQTFPVDDTTVLVKGSADATKKIRMEADTYVGTGQTRVITMPNADITLPIFTQPITFSGPSAARTVTMPNSNITLINASQPFVFTGTVASRTITWPDADISIPNAAHTYTFTGPTADHTITLPDSDFAVATRNTGNIFTGATTFSQAVVFSPDDTYNIGAVGASRPSNIYVAQAVTAASLVASSLNAASGDLEFSRAGFVKLTIGASSLTSRANLLFSADNSFDIGAAGATRPRSMYLGTDLTIDAGGTFKGLVSGTMTLENGVLPEKLRIYGTTAGPKYLNLAHDGTDAYAQSNSGRLLLGTSAGNSAVTEIQYAGTSRVLVANDDLYANGTVDLGRTSNFRTGYFGTSLSTPLLFPPSGNPTLADGADPTKKLAFDLTGISTGTTRTMTVPNASFSVARTDAAQTFTGTQTFGTLLLAATTGGTATLGSTSESITLSTSGTTTDSSANLLPADSLILNVSCRVTTTITTATDWKVGDSTTAARFIPATATLTAGTTVVGLEALKGVVSTTAAGPTQASAAKIRITTTGTPGAGVLSCTSMYISFTGPTS